MTWMADIFSGFQQAALLKDKVERALITAQEAQRHSNENRERIVALETTLDLVTQRQRQPRLPRR